MPVTQAFMRIARGMWRMLPQSWAQAFKTWRPVIACRSLVSRLRWRHASHDQIYDQDYFAFVERTTQQSAEAIADSIMSTFQPKTVFDVGCGSGALLDALRSRGACVHGLEYASAAVAMCRARGLEVVQADVTGASLPEPDRADVVVSMEVGHQLPESTADRYITYLCRAANIVVFSSETPGGGDRLPLNEQPHAYWINKFVNNGYEYLEQLSQQWRADWQAKSAASWFARNVMVFRNR